MVRVVIVLAVLLAACAPTGSVKPERSLELKSLKPERSLEQKPPKVSPQPSEAVRLDVDLPITDPVCGSMRALAAVGDWAFNTPPADIVAALDQLEQIDAAVAVAVGQIDDAELRAQLELAEQDLARSIPLFRAERVADGLETITGIQVDVSIANFMATTAGISCGIGGDS